MRGFLKVLVVAGVIVGMLALLGIWSFCRRARQVRTFADMQVLSKIISAKLKNKIYSREQLQGIIDSVNGGKDAWGHPFLIEFRQDENSQYPSYVLISTGSDGCLDTKSISTYFDEQPKDVRGHYSEDLVFRDGRSITVAGK